MCRQTHIQRGSLTVLNPWLILCLFLLVAGGCTPRTPVQKAVRARLDLSQWEFSARGMVRLDGQWAFYRNRLLTPRDFNHPPLPKQDGFLSVSRLWGGGDGPKGRAATLRLSLNIGSDRGLMGLELASMTGAYRIWIDDTLAAEQGQVGDSMASERPSFGKKAVYFQPSGPLITLTLQLSTHNQVGGSLPRPELLLGTQAQILEKIGGERRKGALFIDVFLFMAAYHLVLFFFYRRDLSTLYFALYCLTGLVNAAVVYIASWRMPAVEPWGSVWLIYSMDLLSYYLAVVTIVLFFRALFPEEVPAGLPKLTLSATALFVLFLLAAQALGWQPLENRLPQVYHFYTLAVMVWIFVCLIRALRHGRSGSVLVLAGFAVTALAGTNDILHDMKLIHTGFFLPYSMVAFIVFQAFALARRFSMAFTTAETLSRELTDKNIALSRMDRLKDEFLANTSHELRTPLSGIIGLSESLLEGSAGDLPPEACHNLDMVVGSGRRLSALVNDILDFSRLRNQDMPLNLTAVDAHALAKVVIAPLQPLAREKALTLVNDIPGDLPRVKADEDRFQQILYNLLGNAIKFSDQGRIAVTGRAEGSQVAFEVSDQGIGIPEDKISEIFEPFKQADAGDGRSRPGTGLGLAITADLLKLHGSHLSVSSRAGRGSTFGFALPVSNGIVQGKSPGRADTQVLPAVAPVPRLAMVPPGAGDSVHQTDGPAPRILVVDDDPVNQQVLVNQLHLAGFAVDVAPGGPQALDSISKALPDLVLLDIMMPGMTGYEVCRQLRQAHSASLLPVLMLTAKTQVQDMVEGFACGANDYLTKPFEREALLARVRTHLRLKKAYQTLAENIRLKAELARRRRTELDLHQNQHRLAQLLDTVDDMIIAVNDSLEISFCNRPAADMLGVDSDALLGTPLDHLLGADGVRTLAGRLPKEELRVDGSPPACFSEALKITASDGRRIEFDVTATAMTVNDEHMQALIIRHPQPGPAAPVPASPGKTLAVIQEINRHQERLMGLETTLNGLFPQLKNLAPALEEEIRSLDQALDGIQKSLVSPPAADRRGLAVMVMQLTLDYWYEATDLDKASLAMESGIWKTYTDRNGYTRTQTLDKYLDEATLPRQPRWKWVNQTAVYVLSACSTPSPLRDRLEAALARFRTGE